MSQEPGLTSRCPILTLSGLGFTVRLITRKLIHTYLSYYRFTIEDKNILSRKLC